MNGCEQWTPVAQSLPKQAGTYKVLCFTGVKAEAYWTGERWMQNKVRSGRKNNDQHLAKLIKFWLPLEVTVSNCPIGGICFEGSCYCEGKPKS